MGRDIHVVLEQKIASGWEYLDAEFTAFDPRNYPFFDFLNKFSERGCPPELKNLQLRPYTNHWADRVQARRCSLPMTGIRQKKVTSIALATSH